MLSIPIKRTNVKVYMKEKVKIGYIVTVNGYQMIALLHNPFSNEPLAFFHTKDNGGVCNVCGASNTGLCQRNNEMKQANSLSELKMATLFNTECVHFPFNP